jgi:hypothetical protein
MVGSPGLDKSKNQGVKIGALTIWHKKNLFLFQYTKMYLRLR